LPVDENVNALVCSTTSSGGEPPQAAAIVNVKSHQRFFERVRLVIEFSLDREDRTTRTTSHEKTMVRGRGAGGRR
jgi:hypothetical protein